MEYRNGHKVSPVLPLCLWAAAPCPEHRGPPTAFEVWPVVPPPSLTDRGCVCGHQFTYLTVGNLQSQVLSQTCILCRAAKGYFCQESLSQKGLQGTRPKQVRPASGPMGLMSFKIAVSVATESQAYLKHYKRFYWLFSRSQKYCVLNTFHPISPTSSFLFPFMGPLYPLDSFPSTYVHLHVWMYIHTFHVSI